MERRAGGESAQGTPCSGAEHPAPTWCKAEAQQQRRRQQLELPRGDFGNVLPRLAFGVQGTNPALVETQRGSPNPACLSRPPSSSTTTLTAATTTTTTSGTARCWTWRPCSGCRCSAKPSWTGSANCPKVPPGKVRDCRYVGAREQEPHRSIFVEQGVVREEGRVGGACGDASPLQAVLLWQDEL